MEDRRKSVLQLLLETCLIPLLICIPAWLITWGFAYEHYDFHLVKGPAGLNHLREFERWCYFFAVIFFLVGASEWIFRTLPWIVTRLCTWADKKLTRHEQTAIRCLRYAESYLGLALAALLIVRWAEYFLYTPSADLSARQVFSRLSFDQRAKADELLLGGKLELALLAAFVFAACLAVEKYLVAMIHESFHRIALAPRIAACNAKFTVLSQLYRAKQPTKATLSTASLRSAKADDELADVRLAEDRGINLSSQGRARAVARSIFKSLCPADRDYVVAADFRPYFPPGEHERAFQIFDVNRKAELDRSEFRSAVIAIYEERFRTASALIANGHIVRKLDWTLLCFFGFLGLLLALVLYNSASYSWISSMGTFILGFSFLFQTTVARVWDTFLFVFIEHAYDVNDNVLIDGEKLLVAEIEIFTTISHRNDGLIVYSPNSVLKGKTIYNKQRVRTEGDEIVFITAGDTGIEKLTQLRSRLTDYMTETVSEFTGAVAVKVLRFGGEAPARRAMIKVEIRYRPKDDELRSDLSLHARRAGLLEKFNAICAEMDFDVTVEDADK